MSTSSVVADTLKRAQEHDLRIVCLPRWYDVDTYEDLARLNQELRSSSDRRARHTQTFLSNAKGLLQSDPEIS